jgi:hypothetical protein
MDYSIRQLFSHVDLPSKSFGGVPFTVVREGLVSPILESIDLAIGIAATLLSGLLTIGPVIDILVHR